MRTLTTNEFNLISGGFSGTKLVGYLGDAGGALIGGAIGAMIPLFIVTSDPTGFVAGFYMSFGGRIHPCLGLSAACVGGAVVGGAIGVGVTRAIVNNVVLPIVYDIMD